jgi:hypothetical protein
MVVALGGDEREHRAIAHGLIAIESNLIVRNERAYLEQFVHAGAPGDCQFTRLAARSAMCTRSAFSLDSPHSS